MSFSTPILPMQVADNHTYALVPTVNINAYVLVANTAKTITFPTYTQGSDTLRARYIVMSANDNFYVKYSGTAVVPVADSADGDGEELNPSARDIQGLTSINVIAPAATVLTIAYYA